MEVVLEMARIRAELQFLKICIDKLYKTTLLTTIKI